MIPNRIDIPFSDNLVSEIRFRMPAGILRVFVLEARDLGDILKWFYVGSLFWPYILDPIEKCQFLNVQS